MVDGTVYIGSDDEHVYALEAASGAERWRFATNGVVSASPTVTDGVVYVGGWDTYRYAIDARTGSERWRFKTDNAVDTSAAVSDGVVYAGSVDGNVYAVGAEPDIVQRARLDEGSPDATTSP